MTTKTASERLIDTINVTGGVIQFPNGTFGPAGDPDWIDLGDVYLAACEENGVKPLIVPDEEDGEEA